MEQYGYQKVPVLVVADSEQGRRLAVEAVRSVGAAVQALVSLSDEADPILEDRIPGVAMVELSRDHGERLDTLLDRLEAAADARLHGSVVVLPELLIDAAIARAPHPDVMLLCDPEPLDRSAALGLMLTKRALRLHDVTADAGVMRLQQISEEVGRIARALAGVDRPERRRAPRLQPLANDGMVPDAATIRTMIRVRRLRGQFFDAELFADPAWDMLLDLTAAHMEGQPVAVSSLCIAAAVPPTTALRWIKSLTEAGLLIRTADPRDGRRVFIDMSDDARRAMQSYLAAIVGTGLISI